MRVMRNRGLTEEAEMRKYLYGTLDDLYDPRLMKDGAGGGADRKKAERGKHVRIIGDYDIDGVCSTYILLKGFQAAKNYRSGAHWRQADTASRKKMMLRSITRSHRRRIWINESIIRQASADGVDTLVTCDNGLRHSVRSASRKQLGNDGRGDGPPRSSGR